MRGIRSAADIACFAFVSFFSLFSVGYADSMVIPSSVYSRDYEAIKAVDGSHETRWASKPSDRTTFTLDFGKSVAIDELAIHWEHAYSSDFQIQTSEDGKSWSTLFHQQDGRGGIDRLKNLSGKGRFFRIDCLKASNAHQHVSIWEITFSNPQITELLLVAAKQHLLQAGPVMSVVEARTQLAEHDVKEVVFATREDGKDGHWYANIGYWSYDENDMLYGRGGRLCKLNIETGELVTLIDDPKGTVRDPVVHYDAKKILFSWRQGDSRTFHLYECDMRGENITQLTDGEYDDIEPCYLPDGGIIFVSGRGKRWVNCWLTQVAILFRCDGDGKNITQLSANIEHDNTPWVLPDGRIVYQRWEYIDRSQVNYHHLWTMNPDGTNQMIYFGNLHPGGLFIDARPIPNSDNLVFINSPGHGSREHSGHVAIVDSNRGPDDQGALVNLSDDATFRDPWPLSSDLFLVARGRQILAMNGHGNSTSIFALPDSFDKDVRLQEPRPVIRRQREQVIATHIDPAKTTGLMILQDVSLGRNMDDVKPGEIKKLLVLESLPKPINFTGGMDPLTYGGSFTMERILGTVPVESDGSAFLELPANRSLFFVALDKNDHSVKRMQSFLSVMPGEVQSCVGCHEQRGTAASYSIDPGGLMALQRAASVPKPMDDIPEVFDFPRDIQPLLDKHCCSCHNQTEPAGDVVLTGDRGPMFSHSYVNLTIHQQFIDGRNLPKSNYAPRTIGATASPLMKKLDGQHYDVKLSPHEQKMIRYWIETGACYPGTYAALGHGSIGGYQQNKQFNEDKDWPTREAFSRVITQRCTECHQRELDLPTPTTMSDEIGISFWNFEVSDPRFKFSRHRMFNLSEPEKSRFLLGALSKEAGGLGLCSEVVFTDTQDADYQSLLAHIAAGKEFLETKVTRFDMPNFRPRDEYFREMKQYGILPKSFNPKTDPFDVYQLDREYWKSLWYQPLDE
ncbi:translocation protein TolB [Planctomycetes bacterium CA13]|uniref:Translocation protein TolB n=1 Tax=Novipirellula herctigrandis TaxID=2527986 RepID=A0A5C5Z153_9BACT|nr:translocation protein TolB [Planctomycetes bacterium CA13]